MDNNNKTNMQNCDSWYQESFRKLFFDFHTSSTAVDIAKGFDAENWASQLSQIQAQAVNVTCNCNYGWKYYRKGKLGYIHPKLPPRLDLVEKVIESCHKKNIKVISYFNVYTSEPIRQYHPEWICRDFNGGLNGRTICLLSNYFDEFLLPQLEEFTTNYDVDGLFFVFLYARQCYCNTCKEKFYQATHEQIPVSPKDSSWAIYVKWMLDSFKQLRQRAFDAVHRGRESVLISVNNCYTLHQPETPPESIGFLTVDVPPENQLLDSGLVAKYWATLGKPFDIMNTAFLQWWGDWGMKPALTVQQECATILANGGRTWIGYQMTPGYTVPNAVMQQYAKVFAFVKERENYCKNTRPIPYVALLHSNDMHFNDPPVLQVDYSYLRAAHKMLLESGIHYNIVNEAVLLRDISKYKLIILPEQHLSQDLKKALQCYVELGGSIIVVGPTVTDEFTKTDNCLFKVLGIKYNSEYPYSHAYFSITDERLKENILDMPLQVWGNFTLVEPVTAQSLAELWNIYLREDGQFLLNSSPPLKNTGYSAVTLNRFGKGLAAYICGNIFKAYAQVNQWNLKNLFKNLTDLMISEKIVSIKAPNTIEVVLASDTKKTYVHLINHNGPRSLEGRVTITDDIVPIHGIEVFLKTDREPESLKLMPENISLSWEMHNNMLHIIVPKLTLYSIIVIS